MCQWVLVQYLEFIVLAMFLQSLHIRIMEIMKNEKNYKYIIIICILAFILILSGLTDIFWANKARRQIDILRGQLVEATESNNDLTRELEDCRTRFEHCHSILQELGDTTGRSIETLRPRSATVEQYRTHFRSLP